MGFAPTGCTQVLQAQSLRSEELPQPMDAFSAVFNREQPRKEL